MKLKTITLGELKADLEWLEALPDDRTPAVINIEFGELYEITHDFDSAD